jgi:hypothetical protein
MCPSLLRNRFNSSGSFIYFLPGLVVFGNSLIVMLRNEGGYYSDSTDCSPLAPASSRRWDKSEWCLGKE